MTASEAPDGVPPSLHELLHPIADLLPFPGNPRRGNVDLIVDSLRRHGQYRPVVANRRTMQVLAGNHTLAAARAMGWEQLAVTWVDVDDEQAARIVLVDNRASDLAGYDDQALLDLLQGLPDVAGTGWTDVDLAELLSSISDPPRSDNDPDDVPDVPSVPVSKPGQVWELGPHRLVCGDSTDPAVLDLVMGGGRRG